MAIRKFRKHIKPFIWFITIIFMVSSAILAYMNIKSSYSRVNIYAFKLNGEKILKFDVEKTKSNLTQGYSRYLGDKLDKDLVEVIAFDDVVKRNLTLGIADDLNLKVPNSEINAQYDAIENSVGDKEQFKRMLAVQGYTKKTFKNDIRDNILVEKTFQKIQEGIEPTEEEIEANYNQNKDTLYKDKTLEEVKPEIIKALKEEKGLEKYLELLEVAKQNAKIENVAPEYQNLVEKVEIDKDGFKITNVDLAKRTLNMLFAGDIIKNGEESGAKLYYDSQIKIANEAKKRGITVKATLPVDYQFAIYQNGLLENIKSELKPTEKELKEYFEKNSLKYDTFPSAQANIAVVQVDPSSADKEKAKKEAEDILKELTTENFKEKAKELSQGPSAGNGGELGWFSKGDMVEPFQKAAFEGEVGKIYPIPVETVFGYHLIYVEDRNDKEEKVKASHILITPKVSVETKKAKEEEIKGLLTKLQNKELTFDKLTGERKDIIQSSSFKINNAGYISGLGYNEVLAKKILDAPSNKVESLTIEDKIYIFDKTEDVKYKKANFKDVIESVKKDYLNSKAQEVMKKYI
ncbi:Putative peptidyl-prolyl cis-trans isomerase Cbf2 precursor [Fusobacterium necrogenes]|uniref:peptidylprolyl isomerase n=1 Tax=Fusobacterium necrogenes TaxID=858 RepID=A0A377GZC7_9FUSO|nr:peptidylprolyl isomerase [Fusobacterium necrogenes]STO32112.1 Putative peptidyl-prolyl cis-trans isomerase Cbf2 precursor [Fusobacterium necrogenes]